MNKLLYRGVSKELDHENDGRLVAKGTNSMVVAKHDGLITYGDNFKYGPCFENTVRAQQMDTKPYSPRAISTSTSAAIAKNFATAGNTTDGFIYVINAERLGEFGVVAITLANPKVPAEKEVTLILGELEFIPQGLIVEKYEVKSDWIFD
ncbi:hypothetical protein INP77_00160 [Methylophilus sp. 13]|uniref:hypothetical protein n=1 Tax=Methylophilus sp. 13 TaxID=2781018 RepID=UPI0018909097|nr:hypothetical protein [Methylophilus sp. 13]MBF5037893.1 hypothetical protein [Methylophilus sp. 13]